MVRLRFTLLFALSLVLADPSHAIFDPGNVGLPTGNPGVFDPGGQPPVIPPPPPPPRSASSPSV
jgi:hypothetical protein